MASPITYTIDNQQYVAVAQGWGGETGLPFGSVSGPQNMINISRLLVFKLGAAETLPEVPVVEQQLVADGVELSSSEFIETGRGLYNLYCAVCHGGNAISAGLIPDLRYRIADIAPAWQAIVIEGALAANGMPAWKEYLTPDEADLIKEYVKHEAVLGAKRGERRLVRAP
jgi:quinohemoprotein ethanol dehydrogenase